MNGRDQQLINEAYIKVLEKAPQGFLSRLGSSVKGKLIDKATSIPILGHAFAGAKERFETNKESQQQINKSKAQFQTYYKQKTGKKYSSSTGADRQFVVDFIKNVIRADINDPALKVYFVAPKITDKQINQAITAAFAVRDMSGGGVSKEQAILQNIIDTYQTTNIVSMLQQNKLKKIIGDWNNPQQKLSTLEDTDGNQKTLNDVMVLLKQPVGSSQRNQGIKFLQKALDDM